MKSRLIWAVVLVAALAGFYYMTIRPTQTPSPGISRKRLERLRMAPPPEIPLPSLPLPLPEIAMPAIPLPQVVNQPIVIPPVASKREKLKQGQMELPIQERATIDYSIGAPVVRSGGKDEEALEKALKEMTEATKDVTFPPRQK